MGNYLECCSNSNSNLLCHHILPSRSYRTKRYGTWIQYYLLRNSVRKWENILLIGTKNIPKSSEKEKTYIRMDYILFLFQDGWYCINPHLFLLFSRRKNVKVKTLSHGEKIKQGCIRYIDENQLPGFKQKDLYIKS